MSVILGEPLISNDLLTSPSCCRVIIMLHSLSDLCLLQYTKQGRHFDESHLSNCISFLWNIFKQNRAIKAQIFQHQWYPNGPNRRCSRHQNVKLTFRILFMVHFNLFGAEDRSEKWEVTAWFSVVDISLVRGMEGGREGPASQWVTSGWSLWQHKGPGQFSPHQWITMSVYSLLFLQSVGVTVRGLV